MEAFKPKVILAPTDFSDAASLALQYANDIAAKFDAELLITYADPFNPPIDVTAIPAYVFDSSIDQRKKEVEKELNDYAKKVLPGRARFTTSVLVDTPIDAIVNEAKKLNVDWIVMGTHGRTGFRRLILGSVTEAVMHLADRPVLAVRPGEGQKKGSRVFRKVLCPVSYTFECRQAIGHAAALAEAYLADLVLVYAAEADESLPPGEELRRLHAWTPPEIKARCSFKELLLGKHPADQIIEFAKLIHADLIVSGSSHHRSAAQNLVGTTAEKVVQQSECPVLVVNDLCFAGSDWAAAKEQVATPVY
jgi:nucleotide-binding universal stress UspA family protein